LQAVAREAQQVDDLQEVGGHHGDAEVEEAITEADGTFKSVQSLGADAVRSEGGARAGGGGARPGGGGAAVV